MPFKIPSLFVFLTCAAALWHGLPANASVLHHPDEMVVRENTTEIQTQQVIVKWDVNNSMMSAAIINERAQLLSAQAGETLSYVRTLSDGSQVFRVIGNANAEELAKALSEIPQVDYAEADQLLQIARVPDDARYNEQWDLFEAVGGMNLPDAWDMTIGSKKMVVAVVDTGILPHADLRGQILPGYDMISDPFIGNDGNGRDADATDAGDWMLPFECNFLQWKGRNSSWHGTHVSGTIAAKGDNAMGTTGIAWNSKILPVRVLGKCGGYTSDIIDGIRWAAGLKVTGVPKNPFPAKVINSSLGGPSPCSAAMKNAIKEINKAGAVIVVAAGNDGTDAGQFTPANCPGVITVGANNRAGDRAFYSNYGNAVEVSAPGGETMNMANGILSTLNEGTERPTGDSHAFHQGTSMAAPHVSGVVALMMSINPEMTPNQVTQALKKTARAFPADSDCAANGCGAGIVDAAAAVKQARKLARD